MNIWIDILLLCAIGHFYKTFVSLKSIKLTIFQYMLVLNKGWDFSPKKGLREWEENNMILKFDVVNKDDIKNHLNFMIILIFNH